MKFAKIVLVLVLLGSLTSCGSRRQNRYSEAIPPAAFHNVAPSRTQPRQAQSQRADPNEVVAGGLLALFALAALSEAGSSGEYDDGPSGRCTNCGKPTDHISGYCNTCGPAIMEELRRGY